MRVLQILKSWREDLEYSGERADWRGGSVYYHESRIKEGEWTVHRDLVYTGCVSLTSWLISMAISSFCCFVCLSNLPRSLFFNLF